MKFRPHKGSLTESIKNMVVLAPTMAELRNLIDYYHGGYFNTSTIEIEFYAGVDHRIGWVRTYIVSALTPTGLRGSVGFINKLPEDYERAQTVRSE